MKLEHLAQIVCSICTPYQDPASVQIAQRQAMDIFNDRMNRLEAANKALQEQVQELQELQGTIQTQKLSEKYYQQLVYLISQFCTESDQEKIQDFTRRLMDTILPQSRTITELKKDFKSLDRFIEIFNNAILKDLNQHTNLRIILEILLELDCDFFSIIDSCNWLLGYVEQNWSNYYKNVLGLQDIKYVLCMQTCYKLMYARFGHPLLCLMHLSEKEDVLLCECATQFQKTQPMLSMLLAKIQSIPIQKTSVLPDEVNDILKLYIQLDRLFKSSMQYILKPNVTIITLDGNKRPNPISPKYEDFVLRFIESGTFQVSPDGLKINRGVLFSTRKLSQAFEPKNPIMTFLTVGAQYLWNDLSNSPIEVELTEVKNDCYFRLNQPSAYYEGEFQKGYRSIFDIYAVEGLANLINSSLEAFYARILHIECLEPHIKIDPAKYPVSLTLKQKLSQIIDDVNNITQGDTAQLDESGSESKDHHVEQDQNN